MTKNARSCDKPNRKDSVSTTERCSIILSKKVRVKNESSWCNFAQKSEGPFQNTGGVCVSLRSIVKQRCAHDFYWHSHEKSSRVAHNVIKKPHKTVPYTNDFIKQMLFSNFSSSIHLSTIYEVLFSYVVMVKWRSHWDLEQKQPE